MYSEVDSEVCSEACSEVCIVTQPAAASPDESTHCCLRGVTACTAAPTPPLASLMISAHTTHSAVEISHEFHSYFQHYFSTSCELSFAELASRVRVLERMEMRVSECEGE